MEKYKEIIDDWKAFKQRRNRHPVKTVRKNGLKASNSFEEELRENFEKVEKSSWNKKVYRLKNTEKPGKTLQHWRGEYYVQEESAALPVETLDPQPGEKILDMCAAPGGKTTQIAAKINNKGLVVANDVSNSRMKSLHANIYRTGSAAVTAVNYDARNLPEDRKFDRILLDAPCSGEGDRYYRDFKPATEEEIEGLQNLQKQLVEKACSLLREEGVMVYSTCTLTPKENEAVAIHAVENTELELEEIETSIPSVEGVESFQDSLFGEEAVKTVRVYPYHLNSGVIFVAKFRKS
ncbi:MAG: RsmB/NOP family class I SAM-dependent RNA methyltransferase [Candidatus Nanohalobium sp.]